MVFELATMMSGVPADERDEIKLGTSAILFLALRFVYPKQQRLAPISNKMNSNDNDNNDTNMINAGDMLLTSFIFVSSASLGLSALSSTNSAPEGSWPIACTSTLTRVPANPACFKMAVKPSVPRKFIFCTRNAALMVKLGVTLIYMTRPVLLRLLGRVACGSVDSLAEKNGKDQRRRTDSRSICVISTRAYGSSRIDAILAKILCLRDSSTRVSTPVMVRTSDTDSPAKTMKVITVGEDL
mmetsp:Transcript_25095/g.36905  ORF Transcript_25095/g.36905 Transcript_25095/m.36905 type:complete len:241 (-) Transcript_25095:2020-2742(-)